MHWNCERYHKKVEELFERRNELRVKDNLTSAEIEELGRHICQISELQQIEIMNQEAEHEFITNLESAISFIHSSLNRLQEIQNDRVRLVILRREINQKLIYGALMDYKRILQNAWYEVFSALDETVYCICKNFVAKIESVVQPECKNSPSEFNFIFTPFHPDFKFFLGKYILCNAGKGLDAADYLFLYERKLTDFGRRKLGSILFFFQEELQQFEEKNNCSLMKSHLKRYKVNDFERMRKLKEDIQRITRIAENRARSAEKLPNVGEGWKSETELFNALKERLKKTEVIHNGSPRFLGRQHIDIWIPKLKVGVEYQGKQHFMPIDFFGGKDSFELIRRRDERKKALCDENGVEIIYVQDGYELDDVVAEIFKRSKKGGT